MSDSTTRGVRGLHCGVRRSRQSKTGRHAQSLGLRLGYWPCLGAPFIGVDVGSWRVEVWWGLPGYR
jgi:hypothetical protein